MFQSEHVSLQAFCKTDSSQICELLFKMLLPCNSSRFWPCYKYMNERLKRVLLNRVLKSFALIILGDIIKLYCFCIKEISKQQLVLSFGLN